MAYVSIMSLRWRLAELIEQKETTAYRVAIDAGLTPSAVYKLLKKGDLVQVDVATLEALARALGIKNPLDLLEYVPDKRK